MTAFPASASPHGQVARQRPVDASGEAISRELGRGAGPAIRRDRRESRHHPRRGDVAYFWAWAGALPRRGPSPRAGG